MIINKFTTRFKIDVKSIVEIGARDCEETVLLKEHFPGAKITTFECNPDMIPVCESRISGLSDISLVKKAVSNVSGFLDFHMIDTGDKGSSSLLIHNEIPNKTVQVPVTTIDKEFETAPDLLWLDTQGSELNILKGAGDKLNDISIIYSEVYFKPAYQNQPTYRDIKKFLNSNGFFVVGFSESWGPFSDAIFVNKKYNPKTPQILVELNYFTLQALNFKLKKLFRIILRRNSHRQD